MRLDTIEPINMNIFRKITQVMTQNSTIDDFDDNIVVINSELYIKKQNFEFLKGF